MVGKGFDEETINDLNGPVFLVGPCAVDEIGEKLKKRLGQSSVYQSKECNDLTAVVESMCHLMKVPPSELNPGLNPTKVETIFTQAIENGSQARMVDPTCATHKLR